MLLPLFSFIGAAPATTCNTRGTTASRCSLVAATMTLRRRRSPTTDKHGGSVGGRRRLVGEEMLVCVSIAGKELQHLGVRDTRVYVRV